MAGGTQRVLLACFHFKVLPLRLHSLLLASKDMLAQERAHRREGKKMYEGKCCRQCQYRNERTLRPGQSKHGWNENCGILATSENCHHQEPDFIIIISSFFFFGRGDIGESVSILF